MLKGLNPAACFDIWLAAFHIMEMLYDTPYPTEPQYDHMPEKAGRNAESIARLEAGEAGASVARALHISEQRAHNFR